MKAERVLWAAAAYNVAFGIFVGVFPNAYFEWLAMDLPRYPSLWQCIGMIVACYGVGYAFADPADERPDLVGAVLQDRRGGLEAASLLRARERGRVLKRGALSESQAGTMRMPRFET